MAQARPRTISSCLLPRQHAPACAKETGRFQTPLGEGSPNSNSPRWMDELLRQVTQQSSLMTVLPPAWCRQVVNPCDVQWGQAGAGRARCRVRA